MKKLAKATLAICLAAGASMVSAAWPDDKPIEVVVGFAPGGGTDLMARKLMPFVQKRLSDKAQFVVINKPGASGELANSYVARAKPDGYTIVVVNVPGYIYLPLTRETQYQVDDFQLIARAVDDPTVLITRKASEYASLSSVVEASKKEPGSISVGHNGEGTNGQLAVQLLSAQGVELNEVPYKGTGLQKTDVLGGHLELGTVSAGEVPELHNNGESNIRAIAQFTPERSAALPNVPTARELGIEVLMSSERGFAAPKGVDPSIISRLDKAIEESLRDPEFLKTASSDAPVISYLSGTQWQISLEKNRETLQKLAEKRQKK